MARKSNFVISAKDFIPKKLTLNSLRKAATHCQGCHLYQFATQTVFGKGNSTAPIMMVGEIPGNVEDKTGTPFTGPAGSLLRKIIEKTNIEWEDIYFTNVVKHFKFSYINNKRMHRTPIAEEIHACSPWLDAEIAVIQPKVIICLGLTAAKTLVSKNFRLREHRGKWFEFSENTRIIATFHPSSILRAINDEERHKAQQLLLKDINSVAYFLTRS